MEFLSSDHPEKNGPVFRSIKFTLSRAKVTRHQQESGFVLRSAGVSCARIIKVNRAWGQVSFLESISLKMFGWTSLILTRSPQKPKQEANPRPEYNINTALHKGPLLSQVSP